MTNKSKTLYTGVTSNLQRRVYEHKNKLVEGFTRKYNITKLIYFETTNNVESAIAREKQIKGWLRSKKIALIESMNPEWKDLSEELVPSLHSGQALSEVEGSRDSSRSLS